MVPFLKSAYKLLWYSVGCNQIGFHYTEAQLHVHGLKAGTPLYMVIIGGGKEDRISIICRLQSNRVEGYTKKVF